MLRIHIKEERGSATLRLEGALVGPWVEELERCWQATLVAPAQILVDLAAVRSIDANGRILLEQMHAAGTQLRGRGLLIGYIVEQIQQELISGSSPGRAE
jgi:hypothetical protein